ncbi:hypothetical protein J6590_081808 [Homalodisca vitripennis]|nr:hypothetical protein J6590_081808 [Homalodisca vitripennis]
MACLVVCISGECHRLSPVPYQLPFPSFLQDTTFKKGGNKDLEAPGAAVRGRGTCLTRAAGKTSASPPYFPSLVFCSLGSAPGEAVAAAAGGLFIHAQLGATPALALQ